MCGFIGRFDKMPIPEDVNVRLRRYYRRCPECGKLLGRNPFNGMTARHGP